MNDTTDSTGGEDEKRKRKGERERLQVDPSPKDAALFAQLEQLFYADPEPAHFPERFEIRLMHGRNSDRYGRCIHRYNFAPKKSTRAEQEAGAGAGKPSKERLVYITNEILHYMQRDCDEQRKPQMYGVCVWHLSVDAEPYEVILKRCSPAGKYGRDYDGNGSEFPGEEEEESDQRRWSTQILRHQEQLVGLLGAAYEGIMDRLDRDSQQKAKYIHELQEKNFKLFDMLERALSSQSERERQARWTELGIRSAEKGLELGMQIAPPLVNQLVGKQVVPTGESLETITLKNFLKTQAEGGNLTEAQATAAFGEYGPPPTFELLKRGVLAPEQVEILIGVSQGKTPSDALDKLIPGGPDSQLAISMEQFAALQNIFPLEQLAPLQILFQSRFQKYQQGAQK